MSGLFDELIARIRARGAITFAEYMDAALWSVERWGTASSYGGIRWLAEVRLDLRHTPGA